MFIDLKDPEDITLENLKELIASRTDSQATQFRVTVDGYLFISDLIGNLGLQGILFRYETMHEGNGYVGEKASQDETYVQRLFTSFRKNWPEPESSYIDVF